MRQTWIHVIWLKCRFPSTGSVLYNLCNCAYFDIIHFHMLKQFPMQPGQEYETQLTMRNSLIYVSQLSCFLYLIFFPFLDYHSLASTSITTPSAETGNHTLMQLHLHVLRTENACWIKALFFRHQRELCNWTFRDLGMFFLWRKRGQQGHIVASVDFKVNSWTFSSNLQIFLQISYLV